MWEWTSKANAFVGGDLICGVGWIERWGLDLLLGRMREWFLSVMALRRSLDGIRDSVSVNLVGITWRDKGIGASSYCSVG